MTTFHRVWFGAKPIPEAYEGYWRAWQRQFPDHRFVTWRDADIDRLPRVRDRLRTLTSMAARADLARYEILYNEGGIYLDCDIMPYRHFDPEALTAELTVCNETSSRDFCSNSFIGAPAGHPIFAQMIDHALAHDIDEERPDKSTGPWLLGAFLKKHYYEPLPTATFYPYLPGEPMSATYMRDLGNTYGIHIWKGSWLSQEVQQDKLLRMVAMGDLACPAGMLPDFADEWAQDVALMLDTIRDARRNLVQIAPVLSPDLGLTPEDQVAFCFAKVVHWLLAADRDRMVWQIGAADGVLVDPLRSALVNYDPPALLMEPNPHLFAALERHYANNRHVRLLPLAYGMAVGELVLNAVDPAKVAPLGLPAWVVGISSAYQDRNPLKDGTHPAEMTARIWQCIEPITVPVVDYDTVLARSDGRAPDILVIDAEGMDKEIMEDVLARGCRPLVIHFEVQWMTQEEQDALLDAMASDYAVLTFGNDMTAYRHDVLMDYARHLYVEHGLPTVFADGLRKAAGLPLAA